MLVSKKFTDDSRITEAKRLVLEALRDHQGELTGVKPPDPELKQSYDALIQEFNTLRGNKLWYPYLGSGIGKRSLVELRDGSVKYDFISGIGVHFFGHSDPEIIGTSLDAALADTVMEGNLQQNEDAIELSRLLVEKSGLPHCFLTSSGVMANENALKIAFQKKAPASRLLAFERCFVGRTLAISQITDKPSYREGLPSMLQVDYIPYFDPLRPQESTDQAVHTLKKLLARHPKQYAVMIFEFVQGEGGIYSGDKTFFHALAKILKEAGIPLFADEVQSFGRTPSLFAFQHFELEPFVDIASIGKLSQVCATLFSKEYAPKAGLLSQTFTSSVSAIRSGKNIIERLMAGGFYGPGGRMEQIQNRFSKNLEAISLRHPGKITGPWGIGAMWAFTVYEGAKEATLAYANRLYDAGLITFVAGEAPTRIRMLPPALVVTDEEIDEACRIIESCLS